MEGSLSPCLDAVDDFVVDLRSGIYHQLGPIRGAVTATVVTEQPDVRAASSVTSTKHHKGLIARELVRTRRTVRDINALAAVLSDAGQRIEIDGPDRIVVITQ